MTYYNNEADIDKQFELLILDLILKPITVPLN